MNRLMILCLAAGIAGSLGAVHAATPAGAGSVAMPTTAAAGHADQLPVQLAALQNEIRKLHQQLATLQDEAQYQLHYGDPDQPDTPRGG